VIDIMYQLNENAPYHGNLARVVWEESDTFYEDIFEAEGELITEKFGASSANRFRRFDYYSLCSISTI